MPHDPLPTSAASVRSRECVNGHVWVEMLGECPICGSDDYTIGPAATEEP